MMAGAQAAVWHQCEGEVGECGDSGASLVTEFGTKLLLKNDFFKTSF